MDTKEYIQKAKSYMNVLCNIKPNRCTGSPGNHKATEFVTEMMKTWHYTVDTTPFSCLDYESGNVSLVYKENTNGIHVSPFSLGCNVKAELVTISTVEELESCQCKGKILLMQGVICAEQLMPKNFIFYNPDHHKRICALLEKKQPAAIITATKRNPELVGATYPFPLIEDGDFDIPSVYCSDIIGNEILLRSGEIWHLIIQARRIPTIACNVIARKNQGARHKIIFSAHIDAKWNTPGALDDASGIVVLMLLAEMVQNYDNGLGIDIVAFNGEDYYSAGGQMDYLHRYGQEISQIIININLDGVGYKYGETAYSFYECPHEIRQKAKIVFNNHAGLVEGKPFYQGDHMIFVQNRKPAISFTSDKITELLTNIIHTPKDTPEIIECGKLVEIAKSLKAFIQAF